MSQILVELIKLANLIVNITRSLACLSGLTPSSTRRQAMEEGSLTAAPRSLPDGRKAAQAMPNGGNAPGRRP